MPWTLRHVGTFWPAASPTGAIDPVLLLDRPMDQAFAYAISALVVGVGVGIFVAGLSSSSPALWTVVALDHILIGFVCAFAPN